ncbi:MAG: hypothetical protein VKJ27_03180 [Synechocystis sp.]|nr:hypothetical protein [Synechocystis sp.]
MVPRSASVGDAPGFIDEGKIYASGHHLPQEDAPYTVHDVNGFPVGLLNCYEAEFPDLSRILAILMPRVTPRPSGPI